MKTARLLKKYYRDYSGVDIRYNVSKQLLCRDIVNRLHHLKWKEEAFFYDKGALFGIAQRHPIHTDYYRIV